MILYEVNFEIDTPQTEALLEWLEGHMEAMLKIDGFMKAELFEALEEYDDEGQIILTIHYYLSSEEALNRYFAEFDEEVQASIPQEFHKNLSLWRRVLNAVDMVGRESNKNG